MAREVIARWREWVADATRELTSSVVIMNFPPIEDVPEPIRGQSFVIVRGCWCGDLDGRPGADRRVAHVAGAGHRHVRVRCRRDGRHDQQ